jgi:uncharacterized protein
LPRRQPRPGRGAASDDRAPLLPGQALAYNHAIMAATTQIEQSKLDEVVRRIVEAVHPLRIILFGSAARGEARPGSDLDVMVVMPEGADRSEIAGLLYTRMIGMMVPIDILVATEADLVRHQDSLGSVHRDIVRQGRNLYVSPEP